MTNKSAQTAGRDDKKLYTPGFQALLKKLNKKKCLSAVGHFENRLKADNLVSSSAYLWITSHIKIKESNQYFWVKALTYYLP